MHRRDGRPGRPARRRGGGRVGRQKTGEFPEPADHALGRSKGGFGTKIHVVCDGNGVPLGVDLTAGQRHESTRCEPLVGSVLDEWPDVLPLQVAGDKGYSAGRIRAWLSDRGIDPVIARKDSERRPGDEAEFDREAYRRRNVVERCIGWLKGCRALATRFEKLAVNYMGTVRLAMILQYLRLLDSSDRT